MAEFDRFALNYDDALNQGLTATGESKDFFAYRRVAWLRRRLDELKMRPRLIMDFGCGPGSTSPILLELLQAERTFGVDVSIDLLGVARQHHNNSAIEFLTPDAWPSGLKVDVVYCNGVFHHIEPANRPAAVRLIRKALRPRGVIALWENNPWNPGTRLVMRRIPFDRNAQLMTSGQAVKLLSGEGFKPLRVDHAFIFPRALRQLRSLEPLLAAWPIGGQYQVLARYR